MYQLNGSHVFFPPQKLLEAWSSSSQSVVEIHDDVDGRVHHCMERPHSTCGYNEKINVITQNVCHCKNNQECRGHMFYIGTLG